MTSDNRYGMKNSGHRILLLWVLCLFGLSLVQSKQSRPRKRTPAKTDQKVYLVHADELFYDLYGSRPDAQIVKGRVHFLHQGAHMTCDSAYFYQASNSFRAFGHVRMKQGDTLSLTSDYAYYDGNEQMAEARHHVVLQHRGSRLYCDSLNFDRMYGIGYFFEGGKLVDKKTVLTSDWGEYHTATKQAVFKYDVHLKSPKYIVKTDTLYYDTRKSTARVDGPSVVTSGKSVIHTTKGLFDTQRDKAQLFERSTVTNKGKNMTADSMYHDSKRGISQGYGHVVYTDNIQKNRLTGGYCYYNEKTGYAVATKNPVAMDFSQKDTLYLHADTMKLYTFHINTDSMYRKVHAFHKVRAYRTDVQAVCDSLVFNSKDSCMTMYKDPIVWNANRQLLGEKILVYFNDSTVRFAHVIGQALSVEQMADGKHYNQVASKQMKAFFIDGNMREAWAEGNVASVYYPIDDKDSTLIGLNYIETDTMKMYIGADRQLQRIWMPKAEGTLYPMTQAPAEKHALPSFAWFDDVRPLNKDDIYEWRGKQADKVLKPQESREAPLPMLTQTKRTAP